MKHARTVFAALAMVTLIAQCAPRAQSAQVWTEQKISSSAAKPAGPVIDGSTVYWNDGRSGHQQIYVWDSSGGERLYLDDGLSSGVMAASGGKILIMRAVNGQCGLYLYDPMGGERLISATVQNWSNVVMSGDRIAWQDIRSGHSQIYTWDPVGGEKAIYPTSYDQLNPKISGNTIVWEDYGNGTDMHGVPYSPNVRVWDPVNGSKKVVSYRIAPAVYGDRVVYVDQESTESPWTLWQRTLSGGGSTLLGQVASRRPENMQMYGDLVVFMCTYAYSWDAVHGFVRINQAAGTFGASLSGKQVVWADYDHAVYLDTFVPEPGSLMTLAMCGGWLGVLALRGRKRMLGGM